MHSLTISGFFGHSDDRQLMVYSAVLFDTRHISQVQPTYLCLFPNRWPNRWFPERLALMPRTSHCDQSQQVGGEFTLRGPLFTTAICTTMLAFSPCSSPGVGHNYPTHLPPHMLTAIGRSRGLPNLYTWTTSLRDRLNTLLDCNTTLGLMPEGIGGNFLNRTPKYL
jgi:hypothetical protein